MAESCLGSIESRIASIGKVCQGQDETTKTNLRARNAELVMLMASPLVQPGLPFVVAFFLQSAGSHDRSEPIQTIVHVG